jgi:hypothetical protein
MLSSVLTDEQGPELSIGIEGPGGKQIIMKKFLINAGFSAAIVLSALAIPGYADTTLQFTSLTTGCSGATCGTVTLGASNTVSAFDVKAFTTLKVVQAGSVVEQWSLTNVDFTLSGGAYGVSFTATCFSGYCGTAGVTNFSGTNLITFNTGSAPSYGNLGGNESVSVGTPTNLSETTTFLNDLHLTVPSGTVTGNAGMTGTGTGVSGSTLNLQQSTTLNIEATGQLLITPEPVSFLLFGTGLLAIGIVARQKRVKTAEQKA